MDYQEKEIVWLEPASGFPYLREIVTCARRRKGKPKAQESWGRVIAYSVLDDKVRAGLGGLFTRRLWTFRDTDPYKDPLDHPTEAVIPDSIKANEKSEAGRRNTILKMAVSSFEVR